MVAFQNQMHGAAVQQGMKTPAHAVERGDLNIVRNVGPGATVTKAAEDGIIRENSCRGADGAAKAQIFFRGIIPRAAVHRLAAKPGVIVRRGLEASAATAIILRAGIPETVV